MNLSYKQSGSFQSVIEWMHQFPYPNCKKVTNLASLRNGVAIAEILIDKLPPSMHHFFLPNIQIYNTNPQRSVMNLKVLLSTLKTFYANHEELSPMMEEFNAEGLYFDHNMMETFIHTVLMPLENMQIQTHPQMMRQGAIIAGEQMNDLANLSSIIVHNDARPYQQIQKKALPEQNAAYQQEEQNRDMIKMKKWLLQSHHIDADDLEPDQIMGRLVNSIFAGGRLDQNLIVKQSHYQLGSLTVFKKVCDYLLQCQRMPKQNVLTLMEEVESGVIREEVFWGVIQDLMNIKISHNLKTIQSIRRRSLNKAQQQHNNNKQNQSKQMQNLPKEKEIIKKQPAVTIQYPQQTINKAENWIKTDLGYQFSLNKSKSSQKIEQNPLLNGVLLGSIIMRMQIGKICTIKQPKNKKDVERNIAEVVNCIIRRGVDSGRKFSTIKPSYRNYLGILWDVRMQCQKKSQLEKIRRQEKNKQKRQSYHQISETERQSLNQWLRQKGVELDSYPYLPSNKISDFCGEILELRLLRETTNRIKEQNMTKILQQLRRVGWQYDCTSQQVLDIEGNNIRWGILKFTKELLKFKVYYYR